MYVLRLTGKMCYRLLTAIAARKNGTLSISGFGVVLLNGHSDCVWVSCVKGGGRPSVCTGLSKICDAMLIEVEQLVCIFPKRDGGKIGMLLPSFSVESESVGSMQVQTIYPWVRIHILSPEERTFLSRIPSLGSINEHSLKGPNGRLKLEVQSQPLLQKSLDYRSHTLPSDIARGRRGIGRIPSNTHTQLFHELYVGGKGVSHPDQHGTTCGHPRRSLSSKF